MAPRAVRLGAGPGEAAELRLRYPASNLCRAGAGGGREGRLCRRSARRGGPVPAAAGGLFCSAAGYRRGKSGPRELSRCSGQVRGRRAVLPAPRRAAPGAPPRTARRGK